MSQQQPEPQKDPPPPVMNVTGKGHIFGDFNNIFQNFIGDPRMRWYLLGLAGLIIAASAALYFLLRPAKTEILPLTENYNIAVVRFSVEGKPSDANLGMMIARNVYENLKTSLDEMTEKYDIQIGIRGPDESELVRWNKEECSDRIHCIALGNNADLVVYGDVKIDSMVYIITPKFYVNPENMPDDKEITGLHEMGNLPPLPGPATGYAFKEELGALMSDRMRVLTLISTGLSYFSTHKYDKALDRFQEANNMPWPEGMNHAVLFLLAGNAAGNIERYDLAEEYYRKAIVEDPQYARAMIGMGSVYYMQAIQVFNQSQNLADIDREMLALSVRTYLSALEAENQPEGADIEIKVHMGAGQCYFYQALIGALPSFDQAVQEFAVITDAYQAGPASHTRIRELAGIAYGHQGLIHHILGQKEEAISDYTQAVDLTKTYPERNKLYQQRLDDLKK